MLAEIARWPGGMMFFTAVFVLTSMGLGNVILCEVCQKYAHAIRFRAN